MRGSLLDKLFFTCAHHFSWPRRGDSGEYYQVCLQCGAEYRYDWQSMKRTERLDKKTRGEAHPRSHKCARKSTWVPRARRLPWKVTVMFRVKGQLGDWLRGESENLSSTGILFRSSLRLEPDTPLEMIFQMPPEISGQPDSNVLCSGAVVRAQAEDPQRGFLLAVGIAGYEFLLNQAGAAE